MFFRLKPTRSGQVLKLIESYRDDTARPRHRAVASLGNAPLAPADWKLIAKAVEDRLYGHDSMFPRNLSEAQVQWVDRIVRQVSSEGRWHPFAEPSGTAEVIDGVRADAVSHTDTAELGPVLVGWEIWKRLGLRELLAGLGFNRSQTQAAAISVINRLADPSSEHSLPDWYRRTGLPELMGNQLRGAGDDRFYRVSDLLLSRQREIERHLRERQRSLFNLDRTVLLYDLTNTHFEGLCQRNPKAKRGANKQKRNDCAQIVVGMVFDQFGFEMAHKIFEGNLNDGKSLVEMIGELSAVVADGAKKPLVVMDAGVASRKNLDLLHKHGFGYLVNDTRGQRSRYLAAFREQKGFQIVPGRGGKEPVWVRVMNDPQAADQEDVPAERVVLCKSQPRGNKEQAIVSNAERRLLDALGKLAARVENNRLKDRSKIEQAIGRIQARHPRARRFYRIELKDGGKGLLLTWTRDDALRQETTDLCGCYVLRTDEQTLNQHQLWELYISLSQAEDGFKALKTDLGLRPNRHQTEERVDAHVFLCVLAYHLLRNILWTLEQEGDNRNWETLKGILRTHSYTTILLPTRSGQTHRIRKAGQPEECQKA
ncbi:MAG: IS1634 family transposase, partial [Kiritimatiellia bacterium]